MKILVIAEHNHKNLKSATYHTISAAQQLGEMVDMVVLGFQCDGVIDEAKKIAYVERLWVFNAKEYEHQLAENVAASIVEIAKGYQYVMASASTFGKDVLPRVAALLDVAMISDVITIVSSDTFIRPIYAGNALATVQSSDVIKVMTVRTTAFPEVEKIEKLNVVVEMNEKPLPNSWSEFISQDLTLSARPELTNARIVISGGRGLKSAENFKLLEKLADRLGAALGASRAAVDAGFAPNDYQVGQTGKVVAPDLYIAVGISGAIQHLAGMKDSKVIVAINNDPDAPIFQVADYGLVADLFSALSELEAELG